MIKICKNCKGEFETTHSKRVCCSRKCSNEMRFPKITLECSFCGIEMKVLVGKKKKYCSVRCKGEHQKETLLGANNPNFKDKQFQINCDFCDRPFRVREYNMYNSDGSKKRNLYCSIKCKGEHQKETLLGERNPNFSSAKVHCKTCNKEFYKKAYKLLTDENDFCSLSCRYSYQETLRGKKNWNYKHGLSEEYRKERRFNRAYIDWKLAVYERYNKKCFICSSSKDIQAHHLNSFDWCEEGREDVSNGVVLCKDHHTEFHKKYGYGKNTEEQFKQFLKTYTNAVVN